MRGKDISADMLVVEDGLDPFDCCIHFTTPCENNSNR